MLVLDYLENPEVTREGVTVKDGKVEFSGTILRDVVFRNYPRLKFWKKRLQNCRFENCKCIQMDDGMLLDSYLTGFEDLMLDGTPTLCCTMEHLRCDEDCLIFLANGEISGCTFRDIELRKDAYLVEAEESGWLEVSSFENIRTDREDKELFNCQVEEGIIFKTKRQKNFVYEESCTGLDQVQYIGWR